MDPVQFGMVMLINCALGLNTPPVGTTQFVGCAIGGISVGQVMRTILPFYGALIAALLLVTYVPAFSPDPAPPVRPLTPEETRRHDQGRPFAAPAAMSARSCARRCSSAASTCARPAARSP